MRRFFTPIMLLVAGAVWLLSELEWISAYAVFWPALLGVIGVSILLDEGVHQLSFPSGAGFILASVLMGWRAVSDIRLGILMPVWLIGFGIVLLINRSGAIPPPTKHNAS